MDRPTIRPNVTQIPEVSPVYDRIAHINETQYQKKDKDFYFRGHYRITNL